MDRSRMVQSKGEREDKQKVSDGAHRTRNVNEQQDVDRTALYGECLAYFCIDGSGISGLGRDYANLYPLNQLSGDQGEEVGQRSAVISRHVLRSTQSTEPRELRFLDVRAKTNDHNEVISGLIEDRKA